jgi:DNA replication and repair protein RecF
MIRSLSLTNFRSYKAIDLVFEDNLTVISGPNAVGKTNLLESIFVASTSKSFRARDLDLVNTGENFFRVVAEFDDDAVELSLLREGESHSKRLKLNSKKQSLHTLLGRNPVTLFEPHDMLLFDGSPERRRRYIDTVLCQVSPIYVEALATYRRALKQRNSLLHAAKVRGGFASDDELFVWDVQLSEPGKRLYDLRKDFVSELSPLVKEVYETIAGSDTELELQYCPNTDMDKRDFLSALSTSRIKDRGAGFTTCGPHRDDMDLLFKDGDITTSASRGETRTAILALKIAEMRFIKDKLGKKPILLLDDVFSELDASRRKHLMELISTQQTLLTTTEVDKNIPRNSYVIDLSGAI